VLYRLAADAIVLLHLAYVCFVVLGGLAVQRWPRLAWLHLPAALWGIGIEWTGGICPLTPLENTLRQRGGEAGYSGGFVEHYVLPALYPAGLTPGIQLLLGMSALLANLAIYARIIRRRRAKPPSPIDS
jgi:hypothetical protein